MASIEVHRGRHPVENPAAPEGARRRRLFRATMLALIGLSILAALGIYVARCFDLDLQTVLTLWGDAKPSVAIAIFAATYLIMAVGKLPGYPCLIMTPLVLDLVTRLRRDPVPYLLAVAMASNVGSTATITGNPQNMIIGNLSQIPTRPLPGGYGRWRSPASA